MKNIFKLLLLTFGWILFPSIMIYNLLLKKYKLDRPVVLLVTICMFLNFSLGVLIGIWII
jgi:hypothetical protein